MRPVLEAVAEHVDAAAPGDLPLQSRQELAAGGTIDLQRQAIEGIGLGGHQEAAQLNEIDAVVAVVMGGISQQPTGATSHRHTGFGGGMGGHKNIGTAGHGPHDQSLQALFAGVAGHGGASITYPSRRDDAAKGLHRRGFRAAEGTRAPLLIKYPSSGRVMAAHGGQQQPRTADIA